ncbi:hypothetical protein SeMB42_g02273 [Synchytrium endobioticum]|uniref:AP complex subunit sigma n=1 Tax=Synchytrium endobioticum TaxID=286115 RepID=A0A507DGB5_9FUNG|nr:hypothetical protein SeLEV6574_g02635 [Synchytrium endobioticum]TPX50375.1 hypothetical protein SeMB42_g02273 [Synchytrium endobioticum]
MLLAFLISNKERIRLKRVWQSPHNITTTTLPDAHGIQQLLISVSSRPRDAASMLDHAGLTAVYRKYASLTFLALCDSDENLFGVLEFIHHFVETLAAQFENLAEIDIMFQLDKVYLILDEMISNGCIVQTSKLGAIQAVAAMERGGLVVR